MHKLLTALLLSLSASSSAAILLDQPLTFIDGRTSSSSGGALGAFHTFDRITLAHSAVVDRVTWIGAFIDVTTPANNPVDPAGISWDFLVAIDSAGDLSGELTDGASIPFGDATATLLGNATLAGQPVSVYSFTADLTSLTSPLYIVGGVTQWFGIYVHTSALDPRFAWLSGSGGDGISRQRFLDDGSLLGPYPDRALTLEGTVIPEPSTFVMLGLGGVLLFLKRRR